MGSLNVLFVAASYAAYIIIPLVLLLGGYRLLFHPLRKYPGPLLARLTNAYGGYYAIKKRLHLETYQNFQKYGPVVRQAPNRLVFNTATALHDIYLNPRVVKGHAYRESQLRAKYPNMINVIDKKEHRRKRKSIGQALTERSMRAFEPTMEGEVDVFLRQLLAASESGSAVNMTDKCQRLGVDVIGLLAFGYRFNTQTDESFRFMISLIDGASWRISTYMQFPLLAGLERLIAALGFKQALQFGKTVSAMIETRMAQDVKAQHDLYSMVADDIGKGSQGLYPGELRPEAVLFIIAGGATTATTMSAIFFYLAENPECYTKITDEIRSTFKSASEIYSGAQLNGCRYLRACLDETLRMSPPSPTALWREQDPNDTSGKPFIVDGHVIPRGTQVAVSMYSINHNEEYFPDSFTFKPERWLDPPEGEDTEGGKAARATMRKAFNPFLIGDRACAGKAMALMEASLTIARTLWFFDFEIAPGKLGEVGRGKPGRTDGRHRRGEFQLDDIFVTSHRGPNVIFRKIKDF